jgi:hypothetical protein
MLQKLSALLRRLQRGIYVRGYVCVCARVYTCRVRQYVRVIVRMLSDMWACAGTHMLEIVRRETIQQIAFCRQTEFERELFK